MAGLLTAGTRVGGERVGRGEMRRGFPVAVCAGPAGRDRAAGWRGDGEQPGCAGRFYRLVRSAYRDVPGADPGQGVTVEVEQFHVVGNGGFAEARVPGDVGLGHGRRAVAELAEFQRELDR